AIGYRGAHPDRSSVCLEAAKTDLAFDFGLREVRAFRNDVDDAAERALPVEHRAGPSEDFDPLHVPRVERKAKRSIVGEQANAIEQLKDRAAAEAARGDVDAAAAGRLRLRQTRRAGDGLVEVGIAQSPDSIAIYRIDACRGFEGRQIETATGARFFHQRVFDDPRHDDRRTITILVIVVAGEIL